jgi:hypothetical protein
MTVARVLVTALVPLVHASDARACGGLFCSGLSPVDQSAEQVLFEVRNDGSVTATVEIQYSGDPRAFSWIIPVHGTPDFVGVAPTALFDWLDTATRPRIVPPPTTCTGDIDSDGFPNADGDDDDDDDENAGGVEVVEYPDVGPYDDIVVIDGRDPEALIAWLGEHGYLVTDAMRPVIEEYAIEGQQFLAMRLQPNVDVSRIVPVRFHCPAPNPVVPSRLTSLAAEPHMGMVVTILASQRYEPASWNEVALAEDDIVVDNIFGSGTNYASLVALRVDQAGGRAFVVERAGSSQTIADAVQARFDSMWEPDEQSIAARDDLTALVQRRAYMTRFYTRVSAEEMTVDPVFQPSDRGDVDGVLDLSDRAPIEVCEDPAPTSTACSFLYCGRGAQCGLVERFDGDTFGAAACGCTATQLARTITSSNGNGFGLDVACAEASTNVADDETNASVCDGIACGGRGTCVPLNGQPTCRCDEGMVASVDFFDAGGITCRAPFQMRPIDDIARGPIAPAVRVRSPLLSCASTTSGAAAPLAVLLLLALFALPRRSALALAALSVLGTAACPGSPAAVPGGADKAFR